MSNSLISIGITGLGAAQAGLTTTGNNTANVNTPGYDLETVQTVPGADLSTSGGYIGTGTQVSNVTRNYSQYLTTQLNQAQASSASLSTYSTQINQIDSQLGSTTTGLAPLMQTFFTDVQGVANSPDDTAARQQLISSAQSLANQFSTTSAYLSSLSTGVNSQIAGNVSQINSYTSQIASLNTQISQVSSASGSQAPNALLDQRDQLVSQLSKVVGTTVVTQSNGQLNIIMGNGQSLVQGGQSYALQAVSSAANPSQTVVALANGTGQPSVFQDSAVTGGSLGGLLQFRDSSLTSAQNAIGQLAITVASTVNAQQSLGVDLNGAQGQNLFSQASPTIVPNTGNTGNMALTASYSNTAQLTTSDYKLTVSGPSNALQYSVTRLSDNTVVVPPTATASPLAFDGVTLSLASGAAHSGDSFLIQPTLNGAQNMQVTLTDPAGIAAASPIVTGKTSTNQGSGAISAGTVSAAYLTTPLTSPLTLTYNSAAGTLSGFPAAAPVTVTPPGGTPTTYAAGTPVPYTAGATMSFNGISVSLSGKPSNGDTFTIGQNTSGVSDGSNALLMGALQNANTMNGGTTTYNASYTQLVSTVANEASQLDTASTAQTTLTSQIQASQQSVSGVNLDEETSNLLMYQQMYQANAQVIQAAVTTFAAILAVVTSA